MNWLSASACSSVADMVLTNRMIYQCATRRTMKRGENVHFIKKADCRATQSRIQ